MQYVSCSSEYFSGRLRRNFVTSSLQLSCQGQLWALLAQLTTIINPNCPYIVKAFDQNGNIVGMWHPPGSCLMIGLEHDGWVKLGVGVKCLSSFQELNLLWWTFFTFHGSFRIRGIDYGFVVSPMQDDSQRSNMFMFGVQGEFEHVQVFATLCMSRFEFSFCCHGVPSPKKMTAWGMLTLHDMDAVLGEIGEQLANRRGVSNSLLWLRAYFLVYEITIWWFL